MINKLLVTLLITAFFLFPGKVIAQEEFVTDVRSVFDIQEDGRVFVTEDFIIENVFTTVYATNYKFETTAFSPKEVIVSTHDTPLHFSEVIEGNKTSILINFDDKVVGRGKKRQFTVKFVDDSLVTKVGDIWEIIVPKIGEATNFDNYDLELIVPKSFGDEAFISPNAIKKAENNEKVSYLFKKRQLVSSGITAAFGKFQVYSLDLTFHLENPLSRKSVQKIAIPPDTSFQKVIYKDISPKPIDIEIDDDGNWLAVYNLKPREKMDVKASLWAQTFTIPRPNLSYSDDYLTKLVQPTKYWQSKDKQIVKLAQDLPTVRNVYDFVIDSLSYDITPASNAKRLGAIDALKNKDSALCTEFTDTFIALLRAKGIPAREIEGYAYTTNPILEPLSLVKDVLHAWPEYYDSSTKTFRAVDPTWEDTTEGIDYFTKLDLKHVVFAIHGVNDDDPPPAGSYKLGPNPEKDIFVELSSLPEGQKLANNLIIEFARSVPVQNQKVTVTVQNTGKEAYYNENLDIFFNEKLVKTEKVAIFPPFSVKTFELEMPYGLFGKNAPDRVTVSFWGNTSSKSVAKEKGLIIHLIVILFLATALLGYPSFKLIKSRLK